MNLKKMNAKRFLDKRSTANICLQRNPSDEGIFSHIVNRKL